MKKRGVFLLALLMLLMLIPLVSSDANNSDEDFDLEEFIRISSIRAVGIGSLIVALLVVIALMTKTQNETFKKILFISMIIPVALITIYMTASTIYLNAVSETGGPVHWHLDYEVWVCGEKLDLVNPKGLSNKVGTPVFHEHNDDRIHVEGVLVRTHHASIEKYFETVGGHISNEELVYPTADGELVTVRNGDLCNGEPAKIQAFLYETKIGGGHWTLNKRKLDNYLDHIMAPHANVPPGDCMIIEFGPEKDFTERICTTYEVAIEQGKVAVE